MDITVSTIHSVKIELKLKVDERETTDINSLTNCRKNCLHIQQDQIHIETMQLISKDVEIHVKLNTHVSLIFRPFCQ